MKTIIFFYKKETDLIIKALAHIARFVNVSLNTQNMSRVFELPTQSTEIILLWSAKCGHLETIKWLRRFNPLINLRDLYRVRILMMKDRKHPFIQYLELCGAKHIILSRILVDISSPSVACFSPIIIKTSGFFEKAVIKSVSHGDEAGYMKRVEDLKNILPWLKSVILEERDGTS